MTAQVHEKIRYQGKRMRLASCPHFPEDHPRIRHSSEKEVDNLKEDNKTVIMFSTACWRGYIGSGSIRQGKLYLTKLEGHFRLEGKDALFAEWFTGELRILNGRLLEYVHSGFNSVYEQEIILTLEQGVVKETAVIKPTSFRIELE